MRRNDGKKQKYKTEIEDLIFSSVILRCIECNCEMKRRIIEEPPEVAFLCVNNMCNRIVRHSAVGFDLESKR